MAVAAVAAPDITDVFACETKAQLVDLNKSLIITKARLANTIIYALSSYSVFGYERAFRDDIPEHLTLSDDELKALSSAEVGPLTGTALKSVRKTAAVFNERRMLAAHLFWNKNNPAGWWFFYFSNKDKRERDNHWKGGSHIHLVSWLTHSQLNPGLMLADFRVSSKPILPSGLHVRYADA